MDLLHLLPDWPDARSIWLLARGRMSLMSAWRLAGFNAIGALLWPLVVGGWACGLRRWQRARRAARPRR